jgi:serine/threonine-protein kinase ATR
MSTKLQILDPEQQILEHKRAGRWTAAQSWYELSLADEPDNRSLQLELLNCLKSSHRYGAYPAVIQKESSLTVTLGSLLDAVQSLSIEQPASLAQILSFAAEASWATSKWQSLQRFLASDAATYSKDFNTEVGKIFVALKSKDSVRFEDLLASLRTYVANGFSTSTTASLATAQPHNIKLHALYELEQIGALKEQSYTSDQLIERLDKRLDILGAFTGDKQYLLGIRRAAMELSR